jgi:hypothetical protein
MAMGWLGIIDYQAQLSTKHKKFYVALLLEK